MEFTTLISVEELAKNVGDPGWLIADCRFDLADPASGRRLYLESHVPGACYLDLDEDLSGAPLTDHGRHPLPSPAALEALFTRLGIGEGTQVVAYDAANAGISSRLWWLLQYMGHERVAVLDGGFNAWSEAGLPMEAQAFEPQPAVFRGSPKHEWLVRLEDVAKARCLVDARLGPRYRGEKEPLDPVAGHIPGATNHPFSSNVDERGRFLSPERLRDLYAGTLGAHAAEEAVYYCGSGVTACQLILAATHAGLAPGRLYAGSWSEWCSDAERPVALGPEPGPALES
jgi:thiosulfate/3-mercaptopyruvate sulfurtransferase